MIDRDQIHYWERRRGERYRHTVTKNQIDSAHVQNSEECLPGIPKLLAVRELQIVELWAVPQRRMEEPTNNMQSLVLQ